MLLARRDRRVLVVDADPQFALTRQLGVAQRSLGVNLVDVLAGRAAAADAIVRDVHGVDVIAAAPALAGVEMSLVGELGRERFLRDALEPVLGDYDHVVIDTPPNLGLLTVNALVVAELVVAPVSAKDDASLHGIRELRQTLQRLAERLGSPAPELVAVLTRWQQYRISSRTIEQALVCDGLAPKVRIPARSALFARPAAGQGSARGQQSGELTGHRLSPPGRAVDGGERPMSSPTRRALTIDDPVAAAAACHVAHPPAEAAAGRLQEIALDEIHPNAAQPRKRFDQASLDALADSIRERGVLQPIIVAPRSAGGYQLIAGERRWRAAQIAGRPTIPALVGDAVDGAVSLELALIENVAREDLTVIEEARTIASLLDDLHITTPLLARRLGRSRSDLAHTVRLLELPDETIELLDDGALTKGHAKALLTEPDHHRRRDLAERAAERGWSVRALEAEIAQASPPPRRPTDPHPDQVAAAAKLHELLARTTGCHIQARPYRLGYQLILDQDAVDRLAEILQPAAGADR